MMRRVFAALVGILGAAHAYAAALPPDIARQLPGGYDILSTAKASFDGGSRLFYAVVLGKGRGVSPERQPAPAWPRPLLLFARRPDGSFREAGRNDGVVLRADEGGQCDPFLDLGGVIAMKGRYFTVENGVACGGHWTDYVTFRFEDALGRYVFDNERTQSFSANPSTDPGAEALVPDRPVDVRRGSRPPMAFENWRRSPSSFSKME